MGTRACGRGVEVCLQNKHSNAKSLLCVCVEGGEGAGEVCVGMRVCACACPCACVGTARLNIDNTVLRLSV